MNYETENVINWIENNEETQKLAIRFVKAYVKQKVYTNRGKWFLIGKYESQEIDITNKNNIMMIIGNVYKYFVQNHLYSLPHSYNECTPDKVLWLPTRIAATNLKTAYKIWDDLNIRYEEKDENILDKFMLGLLEFDEEEAIKKCFVR